MDDSLYKSDLIDLQEIDTKIDSLLIEKESSDRVESLKHGEQEYKALQNRLKKVSDSLTPYRERLDNYEETLEKQHLNLENNNDNMMFKNFNKIVIEDPSKKFLVDFSTKELPKET